MIVLNVANLPEIHAAVRNLAAEQVPYALMTAINNTAFAVQKLEKQRMSSVFDRPTPLIQGAVLVEKATKQSLTATVYVDPKRAVVLKTHEEGGPRGQKGFERKLGLLEGWRAVPTSNMPRNVYGNPDPAINRRILAAKGGKARGIYFIMPGTRSRSRQSPGIYQLVSKVKISKLYHFVSRVQYKPVLNWAETADAEALRLLPGEMQRAVERAIKTAR